MPDIAASDVTYANVDSKIDGGEGDRHTVTDVTFGDGALTYPTGGVPLTLGKLGAPNRLITLLIDDADASNGFIYKHDSSNNKIRIYQGDNDAGADGPLVELAGGGDTPAEATLRVEVKGY